MTRRVGVPDPRWNRGAALAAAIWWIAILAFVPFGRPVVDAFRSRGLLVLGTTVGLAVVFAAIVVASVVLRRRGVVAPRQRLVALALVAVLLAAVQLLPRAEERWHVVQYGLLGVLVWLAIGSRFERRILVAALLVGVAGWLDEGVQLILPDRVYDWMDVGLNAASGLAGALILGLSVRAGR